MLSGIWSKIASLYHLGLLGIADFLDSFFGNDTEESYEYSPAEGEVLSPSTNRPKCPFYGFVGMQGVMMDNRGNACALTGEHSPCSMEMGGRKPCWDECTRWNHDENKSSVDSTLHRVQVFPDELRPVGKDRWRGVSGSAWYEMIMGRKFP